MIFYWPKLLYPFWTSTIFPFLFFLSMGCGARVFGLMCVYHSLPALHCRPLLIMMIMILIKQFSGNRLDFENLLMNQDFP